MFVPSKYQQALFDWIEEGTGNAVVKARAGSGKTTTLLETVDRMAGGRQSILLCAFNKTIQRELEDKLRARGIARVDVRTYHSLGFAIYRKNLRVRGNPVNNDKTDNIIREVLPSTELRFRKALVGKLVGLCKGFLLDGTTEDLDWLASRYNLDFNGSSVLEIGTWVREVLRRGLELDTLIDFDDMVWIPAKRIQAGEWRSIQYDWILSDESQDLNKCQRVVLLNSLRRGGRMICVADEEQSIYGFRGADPDSVRELTLSLQAKELPLSICYRCPTSHLRLAQAIVPDIEPREDAPEGIVEEIPASKAIEMMGDKDLVLCRRNAPLVRHAFRLIGQGKKAMVKGRDIGKGLADLIRKMAETDLDEMLKKLDQHTQIEVLKWSRLERFAKAEAAADQNECIQVIAAGVKSITELLGRIESIFSDSVYGTVFSSVHRAKGLEAHRTFILEFHRMPLVWKGQQPWERKQEMNIKYVALTRSKAEMYFVSDADSYNSILEEMMEKTDKGEV